MTTILEVPCFRYFGKKLSASLSIKHGTNGEKFVCCPLRQHYYLLTPEEHVRQALIWFLIHGSNSAPDWAKKIRFEAGQSSLDVSAFRRTMNSESLFTPPLPVVIFETKRIERESVDDSATEEQLQRYMIRERCRSGFIFNGRQASWFVLKGESSAPHWSKRLITDLSEAEENITQASEAVESYANKCEQAFARAFDGDFEAFVTLVIAFGRNTGLNFFLSVKSDGDVGPQRAFSLRVETPELVTYWVRGANAKHRNKLTRQEFHSLRSIGPLKS